MKTFDLNLMNFSDLLPPKLFYLPGPPDRPGGMTKELLEFFQGMI